MHDTKAEMRKQEKEYLNTARARLPILRHIMHTSITVGGKSWLLLPITMLTRWHPSHSMISPC